MADSRGYDTPSKPPSRPPPPQPQPHTQPQPQLSHHQSYGPLAMIRRRSQRPARAAGDSSSSLSMSAPVAFSAEMPTSPASAHETSLTGSRMEDSPSSSSLPPMSLPELFEPATEDIKLQGPLHRKVNNKYWKPRYVILVGETLYEYNLVDDKPELPHVKARIDLDTSRCHMRCNSEKNKFILEYTEGSHKHVVPYKATSEDDMNDWVDALVNMCASSKNYKGSKTAKIQRSATRFIMRLKDGQRLLDEHMDAFDELDHLRAELDTMRNMLVEHLLHLRDDFEDQRRSQESVLKVMETSHQLSLLAQKIVDHIDLQDDNELTKKLDKCLLALGCSLGDILNLSDTSQPLSCFSSKLPRTTPGARRSLRDYTEQLLATLAALTQLLLPIMEQNSRHVRRQRISDTQHSVSSPSGPSTPMSYPGRPSRTSAEAILPSRSSKSSRRVGGSSGPEGLTATFAQLAASSLGAARIGIHHTQPDMAKATLLTQMGFALTAAEKALSESDNDTLVAIDQLIGEASEAAAASATANGSAVFASLDDTSSAGEPTSAPAHTPSPGGRSALQLGSLRSRSRSPSPLMPPLRKRTGTAGSASSGVADDDDRPRAFSDSPSSSSGSTFVSKGRHLLRRLGGNGGSGTGPIAEHVAHVERSDANGEAGLKGKRNNSTPNLIRQRQGEQLSTPFAGPAPSSGRPSSASRQHNSGEGTLSVARTPLRRSHSTGGAADEASDSARAASAGDDGTPLRRVGSSEKSSVALPRVSNSDSDGEESTQVSEPNHGNHATRNKLGPPPQRAPPPPVLTRVDEPRQRRGRRHSMAATNQSQLEKLWPSQPPPSLRHSVLAPGIETEVHRFHGSSQGGSNPFLTPEEEEIQRRRVLALLNDDDDDDDDAQDDAWASPGSGPALRRRRSSVDVDSVREEEDEPSARRADKVTPAISPLGAAEESASSGRTPLVSQTKGQSQDQGSDAQGTPAGRGRSTVASFVRKLEGSGDRTPASNASSALVSDAPSTNNPFRSAKLPNTNPFAAPLADGASGDAPPPLPPKPSHLTDSQTDQAGPSAPPPLPPKPPPTLTSVPDDGVIDLFDHRKPLWAAPGSGSQAPGLQLAGFDSIVESSTDGPQGDGRVAPSKAVDGATTGGGQQKRVDNGPSGGGTAVKDKGDAGKSIDLTGEDEIDAASGCICSPVRLDDGDHFWRVKAATLEQLISHVISRTNNDPELLSAMETCYRLFAKSDVVLDRLLDVHRRHMEKVDRSEEDIEHPRACSVLARLAPQLMTGVGVSKWPPLQLVVQDLLREGKLELARQLLSQLLEVARAREPEPVAYISGPSGAPASAAVYAKVPPFHEENSEDLARELCIKDMDLLHRITTEELLVWHKTPSEDVCPNIKEMIDHFNSVSMWAATVLVSEPKLKQRVRVLTKLVHVMKHLRAMQNFNSLLAILSALGNAAVHRMHFTMEAATTKTQRTLKKLRELMAPDHNFSLYRRALSTRQPPLVPYLGVHLSELFFIHKGNQDSVEDPRQPGRKLIFFKKCFLLHSVCSRIKFFQEYSYPFSSKPDKLRVFRDFEHRTEDELYAISLQHEPRDATLEQIA